MARYEVDTESGSRYYIDTDRKVMKRVPRVNEKSEDPNVYVHDLDNDGLLHTYYGLKQPLEVGGIIAATWSNNGRLQMRTSTYITAVRELDVPPAPDQPA